MHCFNWKTIECELLDICLISLFVHCGKNVSLVNSTVDWNANALFMWNQKPLLLRLQLQIHWNIVLVNCSSQYLSFVSQCLWFCKFCKIFCCSRIEKAKVFVRLAIIFWMHIWQHWLTGLFWKWLLWFQCWVSLGAFMAPHNF